jgi:leucyl aminopeptidase (aminopeptidase T)
VLKPFRNIKRLLEKEYNILFDPNQGKGSHGVFYGKNVQTGQNATYPIPHHQQREMRSDYMNGLIRCFGLAKDVFKDC